LAGLIAPENPKNPTRSTQLLQSSSQFRLKDHRYGDQESRQSDAYQPAESSEVNERYRYQSKYRNQHNYTAEQLDRARPTEQQEEAIDDSRNQEDIYYVEGRILCEST
jgi:hypothetical protein